MRNVMNTVTVFYANFNFKYYIEHSIQSSVLNIRQNNFNPEMLTLFESPCILWWYPIWYIS